MVKFLVSKEYRLFLANLRRVREQAGLTQQDLAKLLGQTQSFISKVERGERRLDVVELRAICKALKVSFPKFVNKIDRVMSASERHGGDKP